MEITLMFFTGGMDKENEFDLSVCLSVYLSICLSIYLVFSHEKEGYPAICYNVYENTIWYHLCGELKKTVSKK